MSPAVISTLILVSVAVLVAIALTIQSIENARKERHRRVLALKERTRHAKGLLGDIPSAYLPEELRNLLIAYLTGRYQEILLLERNDLQAKNELAWVQQLSSETYTWQPDNTTPPFNDHLTAQAGRKRLKELTELVISIHNEGLLDRHTAQNDLELAKFCYALLSLDISLLTAREVAASDNPKLTLTHYDTALKNLEKLCAIQEMPNRRALLEARVEELRQRVSQSNEDTDQDQSDQVAQEWEKFENQEEDWHIKQDYER